MNRETTVVVVGGGAAGLTAALFLQRAEIAVEIVDQDRSILKRALLNNMPGATGLEGRELLAQLRSATGGLTHTAAKVDDIRPTATGFDVVIGDDIVSTSYVVIASGQGTLKMPSLSLDTVDARQPFVKVNVVTDKWGATSVPGVWAAGVVAGLPSQAVACAGSGATVAIEIASKVKGEFWVDHDDTKLGSSEE